MAKIIMVVNSHAPSSLVADVYDDWYEKIHIPEVLQLPEFISAQRFKVACHVSGTLVHQFLTIYNIEAESAEMAKDALINAAMSGKFNMLEGLDTSTMITSIYESISEYIEK